MAGKSRTDKQCPDCGQYRHSRKSTCRRNATTWAAQQAQPSGIPAAAGVPPTGIIASKVGMAADEQEAWDALIPPIDRFRSYIPRAINGKTDIEVLETALDNQQNVLLFGPKGCGKNHLTEALAAKARLPIIAVNFNLGTTVEDIVGQQTIENGTVRWIDGALSFVMRYGGIFVADEVNALPREIAFALHQTTDDRRQLVLTQKGREVVRAHPRFMFIGTMNPEYAGTRALNEAFEDRFHLPLEIDYNEAVERRLIQDRRLLALAKDVRKNHASVNVDRLSKTLSTRKMLMYEENVRLHGEEVARLTFLAGWQGDDRAVVERVYDAHMGKATV